MPTARMFLSTNTVGGRIYAIGGSIWNGPIISTVEEYDPTTDTWTKRLDMLTTRHMHSASAVSGKIYVIGGTREWYPGQGISTVEEYDLTPPPPDFNGDGIVDISDLLVLIESWGQDNPFVDIAPPFGDSVIDIMDLEVLMNHWLQEVEDPDLAAHWKLDEVEGNIAYDSADDNYGTLSGNPIWQPDAGYVAGALQLDGIDDYISTNNLLNPKFTEFSVFAWIIGGSPGQVVISQKNSFGGSGATWLGIDISNGSLITELTSPTTGLLESECVITDGQWHHIGFVWDRSYRTLYVDGILAANDTVALTELKSSTGGMYIGVGKDLATASFFSGLIDDVRVYNVALSAEEVAALAQ